MRETHICKRAKQATQTQESPNQHTHTCPHRFNNIDVVHHFTRERVSRGEINYHYVNTNDMIADALTKPLPPTKFIACRNGMGMQ